MTPEIILRAAELSEASIIGFRDALIVAAAEQWGAETLYSEDLNDGQLIAGVRVVNPLRWVFVGRRPASRNRRA
jgi:predicted nucleic acid-binding protein